MVDIVELKKDGVKVYPQTHAKAIIGLDVVEGESNTAFLKEIETQTELFSKENLIQGQYYNYSSGILTRLKDVSSVKINVTPGATYSKNFRGHMAYFNDNDEFVVGYDVQSIPSNFTAPANASYVWLSFYSPLIDSVSVKYVSGVLEDLVEFDPQKIIYQKQETEFSPIVNSKNFLKIPTPYDDGSGWSGRTHQATHPSAIFFPSKWGGYNYWIAFTPYPYSNVSTENPCIAVSNDGLNWITPSGLINPLDGPPSAGYNSDTHLLYNKYSNELEVWYRVVLYDNHEIIKRVKSSDGIIWTSPEVMINTEGNAPNILQYISPSIERVDNQYIMWFMRDWFIYQSTSLDGVTWSEPISCLSNGVYIRSWHPWVQKQGSKYVMVNCDKITNQGNGGELYYYESLDGIEWGEPYPLVTYTRNEWDLDGKGVYRGNLLNVAGKFHFYYGMYSFDDKWTLGMATGLNINKMIGITDWNY